MTTAPDTAQDTTLYGPDGRPLSRPATQPAVRAPRPSAPSGDWQPVTTQGNATVWEKPAPQPPAPAAPAADTVPRADLSASQARVAELEQRLAIEAAKDRRPTPAPAAPVPAAATAPAEKSWFDKNGPTIAMWAAVILSASGEYALAIQAHFPMPVSVFLPVAMDVYVIQAMRRHRDVAAALLLAVAANTLDRLAAAHIIGVNKTMTNGHPVYTAQWWLIVAVVSIAPFIVWRVHRITETKKAKETKAKRSRSGETTATETSPQRETETGETTETQVSVSGNETYRETETKPSETPRGTETNAPETTRETTRETTSETGPETRRETETETRSPQAETTETKPRETTRETRSPRPVRPRAPRETETNTVTAIGDRETETTALLGLMKARGGPEKVSLKDAIAETGRPKATAAKRLAAARDLYAQSA